MAQPLLAPPPGPFLDEEDMPESTLHDQAILLLQAILLAWARRAGLDALVARNLACRWVPSDARIGVDPDLMLITPAPPFPPGKRSLKQLRLWEPGHSPPRVTFEVVSEFTSDKDYVDAPWAHGAAGTGELWVFDPELHGTGKTGGPFRLQVWRRQTDGTMKREHAGSGPCWSHELQAWLVVTDAGTRLRLSDDRTGTQLWLTDAEAQTLAHQTERQAREAAEAAQQAAETAQVEQTSRAHEAEAARQQAEAARRQAEAARQQAEAEREREREARSRAEAELEELKRRLASLESRPPRA